MRLVSPLMVSKMMVHDKTDTSDYRASVSSPSQPSAEAFAQMSKLSMLTSVLLTSSSPNLGTAVQDLPGLVDVEEHFIIADEVPVFGRDCDWKETAVALAQQEPGAQCSWSGAQECGQKSYIP